MIKKVDNRKTIRKIEKVIETNGPNTNKEVKEYFKKLIEETKYGVIDEDVLKTKKESIVLKYPKSQIKVDLEYWTTDGKFSEKCDYVKISLLNKDFEVKAEVVLG